MSQPNAPNVPEPNTAPYPTGDPPKYTEAFPTTAAYPPPVGPPQGQPAPVGPPQGQPAPVGPPPGQPMPGQPMTTVNYTTSTQHMTYASTAAFTEFPTQMVCPNCQKSMTTRTAYINGLLLWLVVGTICVFGGFLGCCLIPFCVSGCKDVQHSCPQCNAYIGTFKRM